MENAATPGHIWCAGKWVKNSKLQNKQDDKDRLITNLKIIQDYLCSFKSQGLTVANISATTFPQTLDWLHGYLLQSIDNCYGTRCRMWRNNLLTLGAESNYIDAVAESK
ncbi:unnamed protein product [Dovyalis caffra]|uniref:Uncharacterized protein n=1 Tax=Dovyalis caffra TaxID=77055 RepID=A0AAV1SPF2_9ROSI|nr:unnamed protein product [Dovyalis caffra]